FERRPGATSLVEDSFGRPAAAGTPGKQTLTAQLERGHDHDHEDHDHEPMEANDKVGAKVFKSPRFMGDPTLEKVAAGTTRSRRVRAASPSAVSSPRSPMPGRRSRAPARSTTNLRHRRAAD